MTPQILTGEDARQKAINSARYGRKNWLGYRGKDGVYIAERLTAQSLKRAMLAKGTKGKFLYICPSGNELMGWNTGCNVLRQLKNNHHYSQMQ